MFFALGRVRILGWVRQVRSVLGGTKPASAYVAPGGRCVRPLAWCEHVNAPCVALAHVKSK
jgi:hypothetical protein